MKNSIFARFARAFFIFWHFEDVLLLSTTWNDQFCRCVDNVSVWWQMFNFVFLSCPKRWFQFNPRIVRTHVSSIISLNNWKMIAETRSHIFRWRSRFRRRRRRVCLSFLFTAPSSRCRQNLKYENFTSSFGRLRQNVAPKSVPHDYFSSFNQSNHWLVALSLPLPSSNLNSLKMPPNPAINMLNCQTDNSPLDWHPRYTSCLIA